MLLTKQTRPYVLDLRARTADDCIRKGRSVNDFEAAADKAKLTGQIRSEHELLVEARTVAGDGQTYPACIAGEGACPPEDCGGVYGFAELKEVLAGPDSAERDEMLEWADEDFAPSHFDLAAANATVAAI